MTGQHELIAAQIQRQVVIPVLRAVTFRDPEGIAETLVEAGFPVMEFTMTADNALDAITKASQVDGTTVGCGTVTSRSVAHSARDAGAAFLVAPALLSDVAQATDLPTMLAGMTPTELFEASELTGWLVKLFPAAFVGAPYVRSVLAVLPFLRLVATGGIDPNNALSYVEAGVHGLGSGFPGRVGGRLDPTSVADGARAIRNSIVERGKTEVG